ncbi:DUF6807 family protein [Congregicoccus parvus]|uniref:DUF6807 family protein n=1 Tax=Congregicoccus parvus TaxID=3081749 RepID=UPI003FA59791
MGGLPALTTPALSIRRSGPESVEVWCRDAMLFRYVCSPETPGNESTRPYAHPVRSLAGRTLTNHRPNDHPWHHALSFTLTLVDGTNFWGGPTWSPETGYAWQSNHGTQKHAAWLTLEVEEASGEALLRESVHWHGPQGELLVRETRTLRARILGPLDLEPAWCLRWHARLENATARTLRLSHYHAEGLAGSHYTGLFFRGARDLIANTADTSTGVIGPRGEDAAALHGTATTWMAMRCSHDGAPEARSTLVFVARRPSRATWFVRPALPATGFVFHHPDAHELAPAETLELDHALVVADGVAPPATLAGLALALP